MTIAARVNNMAPLEPCPPISTTPSIYGAANVARAYNDYGEAQMMYDLAQQDLKRIHTMLGLAQRRFTAGLDSKF